MKKHELKIDPKYYEPVVYGEKKFEVRKNDRNYEVGDVILLKEYNGEKKNYTGREIMLEIRYILDNQEYLREGYVILGL